MAPLVMARKAARTMRGISPACGITPLYLVSGRNSASWSSSVSGKRPAEVVETSVVMASTGTEDSFASTTPGKIYVAPPPDGPSQTPTLPVTRA